MPDMSSVKILKWWKINPKKRVNLKYNVEPAYANYT